MSEAFALSLVNGSRWRIEAADPSAAAVVGFWARVAGLPLVSPQSSPWPDGNVPASVAPGARPLRLLAQTIAGDIHEHGVDPWLNVPGSQDLACPLEPRSAPRRRALSFPKRRRGLSEPASLTEDEWSWRQLARLSACIGQETQQRGGVLLHSGLAEAASAAGSGTPGVDADANQFGFLLTGRSGVGKSTACRRLPPPWRALSDDMTLVARDEAGAFWAHPFPTWSRFFGKEEEGGPDSWDVQRAVPLRAIFILEQAPLDRVEPLGRGHALSMLAVSARQASSHFVFGWPADRLAAFHRERFRSLRALVNAVPAYLLHLSREGAFWLKIAEIRALLDEHGQ